MSPAEVAPGAVHVFLRPMADDRGAEAEQAKRFVLYALRLAWPEAAEADWRLERLPSGAPRLLRRMGAAPFVSLSRSQGLRACALTDRGPVGIDIEALVAGAAALADGAGILTDAEDAAVRAAPADRRADVLLGFWTRKEAYVKALGIGFSREPALVAVPSDLPAATLHLGTHVLSVVLARPDGDPLAIHARTI